MTIPILKKSAVLRLIKGEYKINNTCEIMRTALN